MSGTPIGDQVRTDLGIDTEPLPFDSDGTPDAFEDWALTDPDPLLNDDAGDPLEDVPDGDDDGQDAPLEDDGDAPAPVPVEPAPGTPPNTP